jgi:hypothetical protein
MKLIKFTVTISNFIDIDKKYTNKLLPGHFKEVRQRMSNNNDGTLK